MAQAQVLFSASDSYLWAAQQELLAAFPDANVAVLGPDLGSIDVPGKDLAAIAAACRDTPVVFIRHLMQERLRVEPGDPAEEVALLTASVLDVLTQHDAPKDIALQVWSSGQPALQHRPDHLWRDLAAALAEQGYKVSRSGRVQTLSVCLTAGPVLIGLNPAADALVDWPGGRVGLARRDEQISRSEFKLEELVRIADIPFSGGTAADLGASPGGWTRILRQHGYSVWAVDPGDIDLRLKNDPEVHRVRSTAGPFIAQTDKIFDLIVNDMRMDPALSCDLMLRAAHRLRPGGLAVMTLKITPHAALDTVQHCLESLSRRYDIRFARQLFHNRNEVTVVGELTSR